MRRAPIETPEIAADRLVTLTDGVFAIAMTILVLELAVPAVDRTVTDAELGSLLADMWPDFLMYGLSFLVLGMYWMMHHAIFDSVVRYDFALQWLNVMFLLFGALVPFSTSLFGEHGATRVTALAYGLNMLILTLVLWAMWAYAASGHRLIRRDLEPGLIRGPNLMAVVYTVGLLIPLGLAFAAPVLSFVLYGAIVGAFFATTALGRWDIAMVWRPGSFVEEEPHSPE